MKGKPFRPIPDPDGVLTPPPRRPPAAVAASAPLPERQSGRDRGRVLRKARRVRRAARAMGDLSQATVALARKMERSVRRTPGTRP